MGCTSSSGISGTRRKGGAAAVDVTDFDMGRECNRPIKEFPFYSTRL